MSILMIKNLILLCFSILGFFACKDAPKEVKNETPKTTTEPTDSGKTQDDPDQVAITDVIHNFYKWYDTFLQDDKNSINFTNDKGKHLSLDLPKLDTYLTKVKASGLVSSIFIDNEKAYYKKCEQAWKKEGKDSLEGPPTGMDADHFFCAQDWEISFWTTSFVDVKKLGTDKAIAIMTGTEGGSPKAQKFELTKENGKWLLTKIECDMGI